MPPKAKRGTMAPELPQPATKKRRGTATSAPPKAAMSVPGNAVDQTPGAGSSIIRPTKPLPRKKSSANPWAESDPPSPPKAPRPSTSTLPSSSTASAVPRRSERKRGNPDTSAISVASPSPAKRPRTSKARAPPPVVATIRASDGSSSDSDEDEEVVVDDASGPPDLTKMTPEEYAEMCSGWEKSVQDCQQRVLAISVQDERLAQDLENAVIGSAFLQFIGVGNVKGVVDLEGDLNKRGNPRGLNSGHVGILHDITRRPNAKKDHESPIFAQVDANLIEEELRDKMRAADARNLLSKVPMLVLKRKHAEREAKLEEEILLQRSEGRWLSPAEVDARQAELDGYRADPEYPKAQILNGNHRTHAMLLGNTAIFEKRDLVRSMIEKNTSSKEDVEREMAEFKKMVEAHTWRCLVYDTNKLTKSAQNFLVHNSHERPVMGMNTSEKCWWLAQTWETAFDELQGPTQGHDRASAGNIISKRWRKEIGQKMTGKQGAESAEHAPETSHSKVLGDLAGTDAASRLFYDAVSMEMVLDCRSALWAFGLLIDKPVAINMLRPSGGPLVTHVWLALRTLLTLCNVQAGDGLTDAENWIRQNEALTADGYDDALPHFQSLHNRPERVPQLLSKYGEKEAIEFGSMYQADVEPLAIGGRVNYGTNNVVLAVRGVFDRFGQYLNEKDSSPGMRRVVASIRLYARLPTYVTGRTDESFYPMATLPSLSIRDGWVQRWTGGWSVPRDGDCLAVLEELIEAGQLMWTIGAQASKRASNWENWYNRSRGLHQIALACNNCRSLGPTEARLSEALAIFEDPRLPLALKSVEDYMDRGKSFNKLAEEFCARKSLKFDYPGVKLLLSATEEDYGSYEDVSGHLLKARCAVKASAWQGVDPPSAKELKKGNKPLTLQELRSKHPILGLFHEYFWSKVYPLWFVGWEDASTKRMGSAGMGIGWALLHRHFHENLLPEILQDKPARWLLEVAGRLARLTGARTWWRDTYKLDDMPRIPTPLPEYLVIHLSGGGPLVRDHLGLLRFLAGRVSRLGAFISNLRFPLGCPVR